MPQIKITPDIAGERIDVLISNIYKDISREYIKKDNKRKRCFDKR